MRVLCLLFGIVSLALLNQSCDKPENPIKPAINLDTTLYPGNWATYPQPTWTQNTNTNRNVLLEDYTGHQCVGCPTAAAEALNLEQQNPDRIFSTAIHAGPGGIGISQLLSYDCGLASNPLNKFCTDFTCNEGLEYGSTFGSGFNFFANPMGTFNRTNPVGSDMFELWAEWDNRTSDLLLANDLKINIQAQTNYYSQTNGFYLHTEIEFLEDLNSDYYTVVYLVEEEVIDWQVDGSVEIEDYHHHNVFRGCVDHQAWGQNVGVQTTAGTKKYFDYSYKLPSGSTNEDYHLLVYVYDAATYEILQVIKQEL